MKRFASILIGVLVVGIAFWPSWIASTKPNTLNFRLLGSIPVLHNGRVKPLESVARTGLAALSGKQNVQFEQKSLPALTWLTMVLWHPEQADLVPVFRIDHPNLVAIMGVETGKKKLFSYRDLQPNFNQLEELATQADGTQAQKRSHFQRECIRLRNQLIIYFQLKNTVSLEGAPLGHWVADYNQQVKQFGPVLFKGTKSNVPIPTDFFENTKKLRAMSQMSAFRVAQSPTKKGEWMSLGDGLLVTLKEPIPLPGIMLFSELAIAQYQHDTSRFNQALVGFHHQLDQQSDLNYKVQLEQLFNHWQPFYRATILSVFVVLLVAFAWLLGSAVLLRSAKWAVVLTLLVYTLGLILRMVITGRPPVTNLYSSAVFVGWIGMLAGLFLEKLSKRGIGSFIAGALGMIALIIAHNLSLQNDTMEMLQAVLDSNFWLSTHVVTVTIGYSATFVAGLLAYLYIFQGIFTKKLDQASQKNLVAMTYGTLCFALFFAFVGTVLGGIWADQSWGRFWGWDPKENGALMIVLWNAIVLHARLAGLIQSRGLMVMAVLGTIITAFSWFGVNMLGVGLHSYGFMDQAFFWLVMVVFIQLAVAWLGLLPIQYWKSFKKRDD